ncbi:hypothetical protein OUZ56_033938 [Daphnia magna]|uniref:Secreted protein n=1 Tax=Daphnia magna TaxID=35525 RepID=A0ABQ9ZZ64_9CRUS|nr:hypothetical protein OUZ56_033938 [Daphnia magna]
MAAYGVSPVVVLVLIFSIEIIYLSIHSWITKFLRYQTCLLSVADKNWRAPYQPASFLYNIHFCLLQKVSISSRVETSSLKRELSSSSPLTA